MIRTLLIFLMALGVLLAAAAIVAARLPDLLRLFGVKAQAIEEEPGASGALPHKEERWFERDNLSP